MKESGEPLRPLTEHVLKNPYVQTHTIPSMWESVQRREAYRTAYANLWNSTATSTCPHGELEGMVDASLSLVGPGAAPKLETSKWWGYASQWNLLDYPAVAFPVDKVDLVKDSRTDEYTPRNEEDKYNWDLWEQYGPEGYKDAPVSLQLVGRR
jgi:amidase